MTMDRAWRWTIRIVTATALIAGTAYVGERIAFEKGVTQLGEAAEHRLDMLAVSLDAELTRFDYLPALLEMAPDVPALLAAPSETGVRDAVNRYLLGVNATVGAEMLYVLDAKGFSLAASDWDKPSTTIGQDLSFRPYVVEALKTGRGRFYGVGITSRKPGYYLSYAFQERNRTRGVVAVKVDLERAESAWRKLPGDVLLIDERGVIILSTRSDLKFRPLEPLGDKQLDDVRRTRAYGDAVLTPIAWKPLDLIKPRSQIVEMAGVASLATTRSTSKAPWQLISLDDLKPVRTAARLTAAAAGLMMAVALLVAVVLLQRRRNLQDRLANQAALQQAHDTLESTVVARTAQLRAAQDELVHAEKLSALGQMSAGMVHELNQPLTALHSLADSVGILLNQNRQDEVHANLQRITGLVGRLARLTTRLKTFAHKQEFTLVPISLGRVIADTLGGLDEPIRKHAIEARLEVPSSLQVMADEAALASIFANLIGNAIDALSAAPARTLRIDARAHDGRALIEISDTGPGIRHDILLRLFQPFATSKPAGVGLGLGLVISEQLVRTLGGTLRASNRPEGGAVFFIELPLYAPQG